MRLIDAQCQGRHRLRGLPELGSRAGHLHRLHAKDSQIAEVLTSSREHKPIKTKGVDSRTGPESHHLWPWNATRIDAWQPEKLKTL